MHSGVFVNNDMALTTCEPQPGDLLVFPSCYYDHYGVCIGDNLVVGYGGHGATISQQKLNAKVVIAPLHGDYYIHKDSPILDEHRRKVVKRAKSMVGKGDYSLLFNNCETFGKWCLNGLTTVSSQVIAGIKAAAAASTGIAATALMSGAVSLQVSVGTTTATLSSTILPSLSGPTFVIASGPTFIVLGCAAVGAISTYAIYRGLCWLFSD